MSTRAKGNHHASQTEAASLRFGRRGGRLESLKNTKNRIFRVMRVNIELTVHIVIANWSTHTHRRGRNIRESKRIAECARARNVVTATRNKPTGQGNLLFLVAGDYYPMCRRSRHIRIYMFLSGLCACDGGHGVEQQKRLTQIIICRNKTKRETAKSQFFCFAEFFFLLLALARTRSRSRSLSLCLCFSPDTLAERSSYLAMGSLWLFFFCRT